MREGGRVGGRGGREGAMLLCKYTLDWRDVVGQDAPHCLLDEGHSASGMGKTLPVMEYLNASGR